MNRPDQIRHQPASSLSCREHQTFHSWHRSSLYCTRYYNETEQEVLHCSNRLPFGVSQFKHLQRWFTYDYTCISGRLAECKVKHSRFSYELSNLLGFWRIKWTSYEQPSPISLQTIEYRFEFCDMWAHYDLQTSSSSINKMQLTHTLNAFRVPDSPIYKNLPQKYPWWVGWCV